MEHITKLNKFTQWSSTKKITDFKYLIDRPSAPL